jgi:PIN domain nuclease of toxin-antitoxin system
MPSQKISTRRSRSYSTAVRAHEMALLLDTQIVLWWFVGSKKLKASTLERLEESRCLVSTASIWEVAIKYRLGKLEINPVVFRDEFLNVGGQILNISDTHVIHTANLPDIHNDPFDRLMISQVKVEGLTAITADSIWARYGIKVLKA